jgi:ABC-2 type transport system ATP-binding protein
MINVKNLNKSFGKLDVINNMNLELEPGTIFGLVGVNGAGKSTFLKLLSGVLIPEYGVIKIDHQSLDENQDVKKNIFFLSDQPIHSHGMTIKDLRNLYHVFYPFDDAKYLSILSIFNLSENMSLSHISKGMRRQAYIAIAFASNAKYLLLDEVFDGLDPIARLKFKQLMIEENQTDKIIILTSHSLRELEDICDSFGIIDEGRFKRFGHLSDELSKLRKYRIILKDVSPYQLTTNSLKILFQQQEGRVLTLVIEGEHSSLENTIDAKDYHVIDELPMGFEEYFMVYQGGDSK